MLCVAAAGITVVVAPAERLRLTGTTGMNASSVNQAGQRIWAAILLFALATTAGCATTATTVLETTVHTVDPSFRAQSADITARIQIEMKRG